MTPLPYTISIPGDRLDDLKHRLTAACWADDFENDDWRYGVEGGWLRDMVRYWTENFDWREQEREMNSFPHYRVAIDGVPIHFMHVRGSGYNPLPLVLSHGWPWTFWDYRRVAMELANPVAFGGDSRDSFDVIVPSLPGYVFSSPLRRTGIGVVQVADLWRKLMRDVLGYRRFAAARMKPYRPFENFRRPASRR